MPDRIVEADGVTHHFPADATDAEIAAALKPYQPPAGHGTAAMLGAPSAPYAEGVNPAESTTNKIAAGLEPLAHPQSWSDIGSLMLAPTDATRGAMAAIKPIGRGAGDVLSTTGKAVESVGTNLPTKYSAPGAAFELLQGRPKTAAAALIAPPVIRGTGRGMQAMGGFLSRMSAAAPEAAPAAEAVGADVPPSVPVDELRAAGVGEKSIDLMRRRQMGPIAPIASHSPAPPVEPMPSHTPTATMSGPSDARMGELMQKFGGQAPSPQMAPPPNLADAPISTPLGDPNVMNLNPKYPWTPEQSSQIRLGMSDWHSGAPSGTPAARSAQGAHIEDHVLHERYRQLLSDPKAAFLLPMLAPAVRKLLMDSLQGSDAQ